jgi:hypothetical protein
VRDSATAQPIPAAAIALDGVVKAFSDPDGTFTVDSLEVGFHVLQASAARYGDEIFTVTLMDEDHPFEVTILLASLPTSLLHAVQLFGRVEDARTGEAVVGALVSIDHRLRALTGDDGSFETGIAGVGGHMLEVRRIGYQPATLDITVRSYARERYEIAVPLTPAPVELDEIVVEGERTVIGVGKLRNFYRRYQSGWRHFGHFITRSRIERAHVLTVSELLARTPGVRVSATGEVKMRGGCSPLIRLDYVPILGGSPIDTLYDIDAFVNLADVTAIEVYRGAFVPLELAPTNAYGTHPCGVIVVWTR